MNKPPAFQHYAKDYLARTMGMSLRHRGIEVSVQSAMWVSDDPGALPLPLDRAARSAGIDPRSLRDFVATWPDRFIESEGKLVDPILRAQWRQMEQRRQAQSDAAHRTNEKLHGKRAGSEPLSDSVSGTLTVRSAPAFAPAFASSITEQGCSLMGFQEQERPKRQEPGPTRSQIQKAIGKTAKRIDPASNRNEDPRAHLESGIYRRKVGDAYYDATKAGMTPDECVREAITAGALTLAGNRSVELKGLRHEELAEHVWERLRNSIQALHGVEDFDTRSQQVVAVVTRSVTDAAMEFWERHAEGGSKRI
jgi:uncharacterized protein YdaU (DUF1376 family)